MRPQPWTLISAIFLSFGTIACGQQSGSFTRQIDHQGDDYCKVEVAYQSPDYLKAELRQKAEIGMWDSAQVQSETALIPPGGYVMVSFSGDLKESVTQRNWEYVVQDDSGKVVQRMAVLGDNHYKEKHRGKTIWHSTGVALIMTPFTGAFRISILSTLFNQKYTFMVYPKGQDGGEGSN